MQGVILAAGVGKRLRPFTEILPKGLIEIEGNPLLAHSLNTLNQNGIKEVIIVVGYLHEAIIQRFGEDYHGLKVTYVLNNKYYKTGSMYSLSKAKDAIRDKIILLESDLLYDPMAIKVVLNSEHDNCMLVAEERGSGDEVYICVDDNQRIVQLGKNIPFESKKNTIGELVGISKFSGEFLDKLFKQAEKDYKQDRFNCHYEECVFATSKLGNPVYALLCEDLAWIEIDNENDLEKAKEQIYPRIKKDLIF